MAAPRIRRPKGGVGLTDGAEQPLPRSSGIVRSIYRGLPLYEISGRVVRRGLPDLPGIAACGSSEGHVTADTEFCSGTGSRRWAASTLAASFPRRAAWRAARSAGRCRRRSRSAARVPRASRRGWRTPVGGPAGCLASRRCRTSGAGVPGAEEWVRRSRRGPDDAGMAVAPPHDEGPWVPLRRTS